MCAGSLTLRMDCATAAIGSRVKLKSRSVHSWVESRRTCPSAIVTVDQERSPSFPSELELAFLRLIYSPPKAVPITTCSTREVSGKTSWWAGSPRWSW